MSARSIPACSISILKRTDLSGLQRPKTKIMLNIGNPELAFKTSFLPNDGVGLARMEFIITEYIKAHPMALIHPERVQDAGRAGTAKPVDAQLRQSRRLLYPATIGRCGHHCRGVLSQTRRRADVGF